MNEHSPFCPRHAAPMLLVGVGVLCFAPACSRTDNAAPVEGPNVVWVVWDTVRADHLSLYGYDKLTTPRLERWARDARVFDDCLSTASSTVPSHASMFTGLLPSEHGVNNRHRHLDDHHETIAELFREAGYQTYLFAANPHISADENFQQGFEVEEHPWDEAYRQEAMRIMRSKVLPEDQSSELSARFKAKKFNPWDIKACGELTERGVESWLTNRDRRSPVFMFLNYMEAHRPFVPARSARAKMMTTGQVARSYRIDRSWVPMWSHTFELRSYSPEELAIMAGTYDACLVELDELFDSLLAMLGEHLDLDRTIIVLTADHGEHLGEHHMLDHQYSLYNPLIRVPLVVRFPGHFAPGRDVRPVMTYDLFPTLLELAGIEPPPGLTSQAVSLLAAQPQRDRLAEYPSPAAGPFGAVLLKYPEFDPAPWVRVLRAFHHDRYKYIWSSDGRHELYDERVDQAELHNLIGKQSDRGGELMARLDEFVARLTPPPRVPQSIPGMSPETRRRLEALGYLGGGGGGEDGSNEEDSTWPTLPMPDALP